MGAPRRSTILLYAVAAGALIVDQLSKAWVEHALTGRPSVRLIPGVLSLTYTTNSGGAFGLGESAPWLFAGATIVVSAVIVVVSMRPMRPAVAVSLGLILGGALGNLADRVANGPGLGGRVTDFIDLQVWPIFNLADTAIVIGAVILAVASFDGHDHAQRSRASGQAAPGSGAEP